MKLDLAETFAISDFLLLVNAVGENKYTPGNL